MRGFRADGLLCSVWSSSVVTHSFFHCSCFNLHFISVEHPVTLLPECGGLEPQVCPFQALQLLPEHKKQGQRGEYLAELPCPLLSCWQTAQAVSKVVLPASPEQAKAAAWLWLCLATRRPGFLTCPGTSCRMWVPPMGDERGPCSALAFPL